MKPLTKGVLEYLQDNKQGLTVVDCLHLFHTTELRKIVSEIRAAGFPVVDEYVHYKDSEGISHHYKRYYLGGVSL